MAKTEKKTDKKSKVVAPKVDKKTSSVKLAAKAKDIVSSSLSKNKAQGKPAKPTPKDDSESESSDSELEKAVTNGKSKHLSSDENSEDSSSEDEKPKAAQVKASLSKVTSKVIPSGTTKKSDPKKTAQSSSDSDSSEDSDDTAEPIPKQTVSKDAAPAPKNASKLPLKDTDAAVSSSSDSSDPGSSDEEPATKKAKATAPAVEEATPTDDSDASSDSEDESGSSGESSDEDGATGQASANAGKRKAVDSDPAPVKKVKLANGEAAPTDGESKSIFVGRLSWSIDNDRLAQEFASCGEVVSATVQMDRNTGKSRGFGYVHFATTDAVEKALQMNGQEIDGRAVNIDRSQTQDKTQVREKRAQAFGDETSPPSTTLFVGNLSFGVTEDTVWSFFNEWGVKSVRLPTDRETGRPKGFGYVEFEDIEGAKKAFESAAGAEIDGRNIRVDFSQPRDSSGGGGFGSNRGGRGRGGFGDRGGGGGFGDRGGRGRGGRGGRGGDRGGRGRGGRGAPRGGPRNGGITAFEGKKTTF